MYSTVVICNCVFIVLVTTSLICNDLQYIACIIIIYYIVINEGMKRFHCIKKCKIYVVNVIDVFLRIYRGCTVREKINRIKYLFVCKQIVNFHVL